MESQAELERPIGKIEQEILSSKKVKIVKVEIQEIGAKKMKKLVCVCKHPDRDEEIRISRVRYIGKDNKVITVGLWVIKDKNEDIQKGSALANFLGFNNAMNMKQLEKIEVDTVIEETGYLCFKAY